MRDFDEQTAKAVANRLNELGVKSKGQHYSACKKWVAKDGQVLSVVSGVNHVSVSPSVKSALILCLLQLLPHA